MRHEIGQRYSMTKNAVWVLITMAVALLQTTWPDALKVQGVIPDLVLLLVIYFAIGEGEERAMFTGLVGGIYQDVASNAVLGHHVICLVTVGFLVGRLSTRLVTEHPAVKAGLVFCAGVLHGIFYVFIQFVQQPVSGAIYPILNSVIPGAFYSALITPLLFPLLGWIFHRRRQAALEGI